MCGAVPGERGGGSSGCRLQEDWVSARVGGGLCSRGRVHSQPEPSPFPANASGEDSTARPGALQGPGGLSSDAAADLCGRWGRFHFTEFSLCYRLGLCSSVRGAPCYGSGRGLWGSLFCSLESLCLLWIDTLPLMKINTCFKASLCPGAAVFLPPGIAVVSSFSLLTPGE